jgi:hypothetical protein
MKKDIEEKEETIWDILKYKMDAEGFDYCFNGYSSWKEIEDAEFQKLRQEYKDSAIKLQNYINTK